MTSVKNSIKVLLCSFILTICLSCSETNTSSTNTDEFILPDDLTIKLVAEEPLLQSPVAMQEDQFGNLWIVEMTGYMRDIDGTDEELADGKIVRLEDSNNDGVFDTRSIILDSMNNPRALCLAYDGILFTDGPILKWGQLLGKRSATLENVITVDSLYVIGGNIEHQPNGLLYGLDNWVYSAKSGVRYRKTNNKWVKEPTDFRGQWGISQDQFGRLYYNNNSTPIIADQIPSSTTIRHKYLNRKHLTNTLLTEDFSVSPIEATAVNRGYQKDVLDSDNKLLNYTSACAPLLFTGQRMGESRNGNLFVCAPEVNQILEYAILEDESTISAIRKDSLSGFISSIDETFRPVNLYTAFDGSLYIVDMRKGIIQHRAYMSSYLREEILRRKLNETTGRGRIYRVQSSENNDSAPLNFDDDLVALLGNNNLQVRIQAQKLLVASSQFEDQLRDILSNSTNEYQKIHALWTLEGRETLTETDVQDLLNSSNSSTILRHVLALPHEKFFNAQIAQNALTRIFNLNNPNLDMLVASQLVIEDNEELWLKIASRHAKSLEIGSLLASACFDRETRCTKLIEKHRDWATFDVLQNTINLRNKDKYQAPAIPTNPIYDDRTSGMKYFIQNCTACHGNDGNGQQNLAPSLLDSKILEGDSKVLARTILEGYSASEKYALAMPAYKDDTQLSDQDLIDLISYLKSTFTSNWSNLKLEDVAEIRSNL